MDLPIVLGFAAEGKFDVFDPNGVGNFLWTLLIFGLSLPLMWKFVFGPITAALFERDERASAAIEAAKRAEETAERLRGDMEVARGEAQREAAKLLADARSRAEVRERDIVENAKKEASAMIEGARRQIHSEQEKAIAAIRNEVVELSLGAASQVLGRAVKGDDDQRLARELVAKAAGGRS
ncbi:MAG: F0F1 ATP synthase subunit B [Planctomycetota bacterium]